MSASWEPPTVSQAPGPTPGRRNRRTAAIGLTAGLLGGGAIGLMLGVPGMTSAATDDSSTPAAVVVEDSTDTGTDAGADAAAPGDRLREALQPLVDDGTITAAQADSVATHLAANRPEGGRGGHAGHGGGGRGFDGEVVAGLLGIDTETLRSELVAGKTIAEIATEQGVDPQTVIDALVAEAKSHLDLSVANGRLTQTEADAKLIEVTERITERVTNGGPIRQGREERVADSADVEADVEADSQSAESGS